MQATERVLIRPGTALYSDAHNNPELMGVRHMDRIEIHHIQHRPVLEF